MSLSTRGEALNSRWETAVTANGLLNIQVCRHSLELVLHADRYFICSLEDFLQAHDVVGVGVLERDVFREAADFYGLWAAANKLVRNQDRMVGAQSFT